MRNRVLLHILFWLAYVIFKTYLNYATSNFADKGKSELHQLIHALIPQLFFLTVKIPLVYSLFIVINNYFSKKWNLLKISISTVVLFSFAVFFFLIINHFLVVNWFLNNKFSFGENLTLGSILYTLFVLIFVSGIAVTIKLIRININQNLISQEILKMKLETELNLLKAQINPHFLFNTLNNIYALAKKKSENTAPIVMKLSQLLRFMLYESSKERISIAEEIKLLEDYIELEKIRYSDRLLMTVKSSIESPTEKVTPLLLLPLIENVFKHGSSESTEEAYINIEINERNGILTVEIRNSTDNQENYISKEGIGLKNLRRQLELTYADFDLKIENKSNLFEVKLMVNLKSYGKN